MNLFKKLFGNKKENEVEAQLGDINYKNSNISNYPATTSINKDDRFDMKPIVDTMDKAINDLNKLKAPTTESQNKQIIKHLKQGKTLTSIEALNLFNCFRLSARIHDLRSFGFNIKTTNVIKNSKRVAEYKLV